MSNGILIVVICVIVIAAIAILLAIRSRKRRTTAGHHIGLPQLGALAGPDHEESVAEVRAAHRDQAGPTDKP
jgi:hypothetical protein